jgi:hypothetical protein
MEHAFNPSYLEDGGRRIVKFSAQAKILVRLCLKNKNKSSGGVAQVVEVLT